jgi:hypothetical protein
MRLCANRPGDRASRMETASAGRVSRTRHLAANRRLSRFRPRMVPWDGRKEGLRIRMARIAVEALYRGDFATYPMAGPHSPAVAPIRLNE